MREHISELLPIVHLPTVRSACRKYGLMFKSLPRCLFLTRQDLGDVHRVLKNWPERNIKVVMVTDGEKVGPAGDLGVHAGAHPPHPAHATHTQTLTRILHIQPCASVSPHSSALACAAEGPTVATGMQSMRS